MSAEFLEAVRAMRELQRAWFGGDKSEATLQAAKSAERRVDKMLRDIDAAEHQPGLAFGDDE